MHDVLIAADDIFLQDVICSVVGQYIKAEDIVIYNKVSTMVDIKSLKTTKKILELIRINRNLLSVN